MLKRERQEILSWAAGISDKKLEEEYYSAAYACLGSAAEEMYERGYAEEDIREREKYEKYLGEKADIIESLCMSRGIKLWEGCGENEEGSVNQHTAKIL